MISAFGVSRFTADGKQKSPVIAIQEINARIDSMGITSDDVVSISVDEGYYHVFYKSKAE